MILLHAGVLRGILYLWGETPVEEPRQAVTKRGRPPKRTEARTYPFDAGAEGVRWCLRHAAPGFPFGSAQSHPLLLLAPTKGWDPVATSPLIAEPPKSRARLMQIPWKVEALRLEPAETVELLCTCMAKKVLAPGIVIGSDIQYWADVLKFAGEIVANRQVCAGMRMDSDPGPNSTSWEPALDEERSRKLTFLASQMPPPARSLSDPEAPPIAPTTALPALREFLNRMVDYLFRSGVSDGRLPRRHNKRQKEFSSIHDAWLHLLRSAPRDGRNISDDDLRELAALVPSSRETSEHQSQSGFRLCFRLEEPAEPLDSFRSSPWFLRFLLQSVSDPSLLIPLSDLWDPATPRNRAFGDQVPILRKFALASLAQAAHLCPLITPAMEEREPKGCVMPFTSVYEFLSEKAQTLEECGFGIMVPSWWAGRGTRGRLALQAAVGGTKIQSKAELTLSTLVRFDWQVALGEEVLSRDELQAIAEMKQPLVRLRGQWVHLDPEEIHAVSEFLRTGSVKHRPLKDALFLALNAQDGVEGLEFKGIRASGWFEKLLSQLQDGSSYEVLDPPARFVGTLRPYQVRGYSWLAFLRRWGLGACLADDMGLGKTIQALALFQGDWNRNGKRPVLLVCPTSLVNNWSKEAARFTPDLTVMVHHGTDRNRGENFRNEANRHAVVISSYGLLHRDIEFLRGVNWAGVILDEAQNIKNPETKQAGAARLLDADYRLALTGTPVENNVGDLWSIMEFLNPGLLGTQASFKRKFFLPIQSGQDALAGERLKKTVAPFILRRIKTDKTVISDLPDKMEMKVYCSLTREQASLYTAVLREAEEIIQGTRGIQRKGVVLATLSRLKQVCNHPAQFLRDNSPLAGRSGKLARLTEMIEEVLSVGEKALVFSQFAEMGELLRRHLQRSLAARPFSYTARYRKKPVIA